MTERIVAGVFLTAVLWAVFRFAMGLRAQKLAREEAQRAESARGRRAVAEVLTAGGELMLFLEDGEEFYWGEKKVRKSEIVGARILLNGGVIRSFNRRGVSLPEPPSAEAYEGKERWDVEVYLRGGGVFAIPCGGVREGVSRDSASAIFRAVEEAALGPR